MERVYYIYSAPDDDGGPLSVIAVKSVLTREHYTTVYVAPVYQTERERESVCQFIAAPKQHSLRRTTTQQAHILRAQQGIA